MFFVKKCTISNQRPRITFDKNGICSACNFAAFKQTQINWKERKEELNKLCDLHRKKDGSYVLKHKTIKAKKDDCKECGQNPKNRDLGLLYRYKSDDMNLVRDHIEQHLREYSKHKSVTPKWCGTCKALIEYFVEVDVSKTLGFYEKSD